VLSTILKKLSLKAVNVVPVSHGLQLKLLWNLRLLISMAFVVNITQPVVDEFDAIDVNVIDTVLVDLCCRF
jgi:hypothetical protein